MLASVVLIRVRYDISGGDDVGLHHSEHNVHDVF